MNSKIKNTILEGILIGTLALNGCSPEIEIKAKVIETQFITNSNSNTIGTGYITAQDGTKPYSIKVEGCSCNKELEKYEFESKIKKGDSISFKKGTTMQLEDITVLYRSNSSIENNIIYTK